MRHRRQRAREQLDLLAQCRAGGLGGGSARRCILQPRYLGLQVCQLSFDGLRSFLGALKACLGRYGALVGRDARRARLAFPGIGLLQRGLHLLDLLARAGADLVDPACCCLRICRRRVCQPFVGDALLFGHTQSLSEPISLGGALGELPLHCIALGSHCRQLLYQFSVRRFEAEALGREGRDFFAALVEVSLDLLSGDFCCNA